jgi:hypothetical protein
MPSPPRSIVDDGPFEPEGETATAVTVLDLAPDASFGRASGFGAARGRGFASGSGFCTR